MKRMQIITTPISALLVLSALTGIASAATESTKILPEPTGAAATSFTVKGGEGKLEQVSGSTITCKKDVGNGTFTSPNLGSLRTLLGECSSALDTICTGVEDETGAIEIPVAIHYVLALEMITATTSTLVAAFAFLSPQIVFECSNTPLGITLLVLIRGCVAGVAGPANALTKSTQVTFKEFTKGENKILSILMENNTKAETKCLLETVISEEGAEEKLELTALIAETPVIFEKWHQSGTEIEILLMN